MTEQKDGDDDLAMKIRRCTCCGILPSLFAHTTWRFDYNCLESGEKDVQSFQFGCEGCHTSTPRYGSIEDALSYWNRMIEKGGCE